MNLSSALVLGATGATGRHVVQNLLNNKIAVTAIVRSKERLLECVSLSEETKDLLTIRESPSLDAVSQPETDKILASVDVVISCLGHNLTFQGIWGHPRRLVTDSVQKFQHQRFILMNSDGCAAPHDAPRGWVERTILSILRSCVPPHADNEEASAYLAALDCEWVIVRPTDLTLGEAKPYQVYDSPPGGLFGDGSVSRATVGAFISNLVTDSTLWDTYKHKYPVIHDPVEDKKQD